MYCHRFEMSYINKKTDVDQLFKTVFVVFMYYIETLKVWNASKISLYINKPYSRFIYFRNSSLVFSSLNLPLY